MASQSDAAKTAKVSKPGKPCIVFELENAAFHGAQIMYDILAGLFKARDFKLTPELFARFGLARPTARNINRMFETLAMDKTGVEALTAELARQFPLKIAQSKPAPLTAKLLGEAERQGVQLGAVSSSTEPVAQELLKALGLKPESVAVCHVSGNGNGRPRSETWMKLARQMQARPAQCVALVNCSMSARAAIIAGMRCVAIPDAHSAYQDFGGVDLVVENQVEPRLPELLALAAPVAGR